MVPSTKETGNRGPKTYQKEARGEAYRGFSNVRASFLPDKDIYMRKPCSGENNGISGNLPI
jgi:hypothetical protein